MADEIWCEGAALIDCDAQDLLWFGGEDVIYDAPLRLTLFALLSATWPDWSIRWAGGHLAEIGQSLGLPASTHPATRSATP